jgi:Trypsin-like peptidase domain
MFAAACDLAQQFTRPVVLSFRHRNGKCSSGIGSFVVINPEGWAVTAFHIIDQIEQAAKAASLYNETEEKRSAIQNNAKISQKDRVNLLKGLPKFGPDAITNSSDWWSWDGVKISSITAIPAVDLAFLKLEGFDSRWVSKYPCFKDPGKTMTPGRSLCKLGFPFHNIEPIFHEKFNSFELPAGSVPLPLFPIDGILTRFVDVTLPPDGAQPPFKLRYIETSSPGLRGQSGGPIFDALGTVWAIQSQTVHYPLGFSPNIPGGKQHEREHQFLNVGRGISAETIVGAMHELGISFTLAED